MLKFAKDYFFIGGVRIQKKIYSRPYSEIFEDCLASVRRLGWKLISQNDRIGEIRAKTGTTLWSWGEDISIHVSEEPAGTTISVLSEASSQIFDWGKSGENERAFHEELEEIVSS